MVAERVSAKPRDALATGESARAGTSGRKPQAPGLHEPGRAPVGLSSAARRQVCPAKR